MEKHLDRYQESRRSNVRHLEVYITFSITLVPPLLTIWDCVKTNLDRCPTWETYQVPSIGLRRTRKQVCRVVTPSCRYLRGKFKPTEKSYWFCTPGGVEIYLSWRTKKITVESNNKDSVHLETLKLLPSIGGLETLSQIHRISPVNRLGEGIKNNEICSQIIECDIIVIEICIIYLNTLVYYTIALFKNKFCFIMYKE